MNNFVFVCNLTDIPPNKGKRFVIEEEEIALFHYEGKFYALNNICPHQHKSIISDGFLEEGFVSCPAHGWRFSLANGKKEGKFRGLTTYDVKIEEGKVFIDFKKKELLW